MLIGFQVDLTDLASPWRGTASSQGEGFCTGVSRAKEGVRAGKRESGLKKKKKKEEEGGGVVGWMWEGGGLQECGRYCQLACGSKKVLTGEVTQSR